MFKIKICGITTPEDALLAAAAGADAIGLNFCEKSPRYVTPERASVIVGALAPGVAAVGVFVDSALEQIVRVQRHVGLDIIQLHGSEPPSFLYQLRASPFLKVNRPSDSGFQCDEVQLIRAIRCSGADFSDATRYLVQCARQNPATKGQPAPNALLLDAYDTRQLGGTGIAVDWLALKRQRDTIPCRLILAGGLTPENVAQAIATARPDAVDVASGVESSPGKKDAAKMRAFVVAAKQAFAVLDK